MALWNRLFGKRDQDSLPPDLIMARAVEGLRIKQEFAAQTWGLGQTDAVWNVDLSAGLITFTRANGMRASAPVQVIGTFNTLDATFLWGWDHPSIPEPCRVDALRVRAWGERHSRQDMTTRKISCTEALAWEYTALAAHLSDAQGGYRGPSGTTLVYMTFGTVTLNGKNIAAPAEQQATTPDDSDWGRGLTPVDAPDVVAFVQAYHDEMFVCDEAYHRHEADEEALEHCIVAKCAIYEQTWRRDDDYWRPCSAGWPSGHDPRRLSGWRSYVLGPDAWRVCCEQDLGSIVIHQAFDVVRFPDGLRIVDEPL